MLSLSNDYHTRYDILEKKGLLTNITMKGSHHLHLDEETAPICAKHIHDFLLN